MMNIAIVLSVLLFEIHCIQAEDHIHSTDNILPLPLPYVSKFTSGNTKCRGDDICNDSLNITSSWCYTDYSDNWDYCCTSKCDYNGEKFLWCQSGVFWQYCGNNRTTDIQGRACLETYPCGAHSNDLSPDDAYYWCYVDLDGNWDYCCAPHTPCSFYSKNYAWCHVELSSAGKLWKKCKPLENDNL
ncbi:hypothetical protein ACJMK2_021543 [Sinanodonta woodiana]|uniref:Uncharacterized protein n=1 Tax=Sinanodonta woodiana TaxID=1069815 RepID=A0ABD3TGE6_SINWO